MRLDGPDVALILLILLLLQMLFPCSGLPLWLLLLNEQSQLGTVGRQPPIQWMQSINVAIVSNPLAWLLLLMMLIIAIDISDRTMHNCSCSSSLRRCR